MKPLLFHRRQRTLSQFLQAVQLGGGHQLLRFIIGRLLGIDQQGELGEFLQLLDLVLQKQI